MRNILIFFIVGLSLASCRHSKVEGIVIGFNLYENQSYSDNQELCQLIRQALSKDEKALAQLLNFWCGGGAGCYDLGFIVTQIIYRLGEKDFMTMVDKLDKMELSGLEGLIMTGLEYGDNDKDGKMDNKFFENEFPDLYKVVALSQNSNNKKKINKPTF